MKNAFFAIIVLLLASCAEVEEEHDFAITDPLSDDASDLIRDPDGTDTFPDRPDVHDTPTDTPLDPAADAPGDFPETDAIADTSDVPPDPDGEDLSAETLCGGSTCPAGHTCCYDIFCVNLDSDEHNCGSCGNYCRFDEADVCVSGNCICSGSSRKCSGLPDDSCCESDGCRNLNTDNDHCSMCDWWCSPGENCIDGWCETW